MPDNDKDPQDIVDDGSNDPASTKDGQPVDWESRYKGTTRVLNQKVQEIADLQKQLDGANAATEAIQKTLNDNQAQWDAARLGLEQQLTAATAAKDTTAAELAVLQSYKIKMEAIKEFPELLPLAETIPAMDNEELMKSHLATLQAALDAVAQNKADKLVAGLTPGATHKNSDPAYHYSTQQQWQDAMNSAAGSDEFQKVADAYMHWAEHNQS